MGNCTTCDDPSIYESNTETKPLRSAKAPIEANENKENHREGNFKENLHTTPVTHKVLSNKRQDCKSQHFRSDLVKVAQVPDFTNPYTAEVLAKLGPYIYKEPFDGKNFFGPVEIEPNVFYEG